MQQPTGSFGEAFANELRSINAWIHRVLLLLADAAMLAMVGIVTVAVVQRYVFNFNIAWVEEIPRLLVTLLAFVSCAIGVRDHMHVSMNVIYNLFPKTGRRVLDWFIDFVVGAAGLVMLIFGTILTIQQMGRPGHLPITGIPNWVQYVPVPVAGFMIVFDSILFLTGVLRHGDLLYSEPEIDYAEVVREQQKELARNEGGARS
ncbi:MAG: TRAP transporter small permease [Oscillospiraceae bacterium]|jgi:TRAP-type C4-dicarboxylate transport system permease small subunit|nr:TRAP transporter small permease [Oscillospiraceae bacterium]